MIFLSRLCKCTFDASYGMNNSWYVLVHSTTVENNLKVNLILINKKIEPIMWLGLSVEEE